MDSRSGHSIGIVENPLYADEEGGPQYSVDIGKDKEAEVCINHRFTCLSRVTSLLTTCVKPNSCT